MLLGCIADDFTGAADVANTLSREGMRTIVLIGVPRGPIPPAHDAAVIALKSRSCPAERAVEESIAALHWLRKRDCRQILFKYCSTFDSTDKGNIGPVAAALATVLGTDLVPFCPAFPATGRTVVHGHLFVNGRLLAETGMRHHPLTPMADSDLRRVLARQAGRAVGSLDLDRVRDGVGAIRAELHRERENGQGFIIVDAMQEADLRVLGRAFADLPLVTGASGIAMGLAADLASRGLLTTADRAWRGQSGPAVALCGSCSETSLEQVARHRDQGFATLAIDVDALINGRLTAADAANWAMGYKDRLPLIYSSAPPARLRALHDRHGRDLCARKLDEFFAALASVLVEAGVARLVVAGGETSGAAVAGLGLNALEIGPEIAPGVPAMRGGKDLVLTLKSGNFGGSDFFARAASVLETMHDNW